MGLSNFFKKLFSTTTCDNHPCTKPINGVVVANGDSSHYPNEYKRVLVFNLAVNTLLSNDMYIARSDYRDIIAEYEDLPEFYGALIKSGLLIEYICKHNLDANEITLFLSRYTEMKDLQKEAPIFRAHNDKYISSHLQSEKEYLDNILKACDPAISLDNEQREVVLSNEDHTLVIAGAGAGKTTTVAAKVRYLVEKQGIAPENILVISFTNKAVDELRDRINHMLKIPCEITTFHSVGYSILRKGDEEQKRIVEGGFMYNVVNEYLKSRVLRNPDLVNKLILFFGSYFSAPYEGENLNEYFQFVANADFSTLKSNLHEYVKEVIDRKTNKAQTLNNEVLRSMEEVRIANFLYMHQIEYEYEPIYQYRILDSNKPYTPDFRIKQGDKVAYIEHFGITEDGHSSRYSAGELEKYKSRIKDKIRLHKQHHTDLIYTFSLYNDGRDLIEHLREKLVLLGFELIERPAGEVYQKLVDSEENKYITKLTWLACSFIQNFKTQGYKPERFDDFRFATKNVRTKLFLDICSVCYHEYQKALAEQHCIDFQDMINDAAEIIRRKQVDKEYLDYKYIIVDEYQDISRQRYNLIRELSKLCNAKIMAVGDDWQSIYAFSGSILPLFTKFCEEVGYGQELKITRTYRNAQEIIDIAGTFVQKNATQIRKELISPKRIDNPVIINTYSEDVEKGKDKPVGGVYYNLGNAIHNAINEIVEYNQRTGGPKTPSILLIGRYGFDARNMCKSNEFNYDEKSGRVYSASLGSKVKLQFLTAHSSKGLSADNVIIINAKDETYGFPSKVDDDPILNLGSSNDTSYNYAEERRLFYVALTRTKNRVFIITPERRPSEFIKELLSEPHNYPNVTLNGALKVDVNAPKKIKDSCPICGYPMQFKWNKNYGLRLWICSNDQEVCGFMTNDKRGGELSIHKCDWCQDGYLVVKSGNTGYFLGCTNYKTDKTGCNRSISIDHYRIWLNNDFGNEDLTQPQTCLQSEEPTITHELPVPKPKVERKPTKRKKSHINSISYQEQVIDVDGFKVLVSTEGEIITDLELLKKIRSFRSEVAKEKNLPAYCILQNKALVSLATEKPTTFEELRTANGIGAKTVELYGAKLLEIIVQHMSEDEYITIPSESIK